MVYRDGPDGELSGAASLRYATDAGRYRLSCSTDPSLGLLGDIDAAWDGERFQLLLADSGVLSTSRFEPAEFPTALPNPFFLPLDFLRRTGPACTICNLRLDLVRQPPELEVATLRTASPGATGLVELVSTGDGTIHFRVEHRAVADGLAVPVRIERLTDDPDARAVIELSDYERSGSAAIWLPRRIGLRGVDESGATVTRVEYLIHSLALDEPTDEGVFRIDPGPGVKIWDSDLETFIDDD